MICSKTLRLKLFCACEQTAKLLEGDFQVLSCPPDADYGAALKQAAEAARSEQLLFGFDEGVVSVERERFLQAEGAVVCCETTARRLLAKCGGVPLA